MPEIQIPFGGFYESLLSDLVDRDGEQFPEYEAEGEADPEDSRYQPKELRLPEKAFSEALWRAYKPHEAYEEIARHYVQAFQNLLESESGLKIRFKFAAITSPKYYNFETDRIFCDISGMAVKKLFAYSRKLDGHDTLKRIIEERFTSRDGFYSRYSNSLAEWLEKPLAVWDHNELGTLLLVAVETMGDDYDFSIYEDLADNSYRYFEMAVDWPTYRNAIEEAREELRESILAENPEYEPPYRCDKTLDLFRPSV